MVCRNEDVMVDSADELSGEPERGYHALSTLAKAQLLRQRLSLPEPALRPQAETQDATRSGKRPMQRAPPVKRKRREASRASDSDIEARPCGIRWVRWIFDADPACDTTCSKRKDCQQHHDDQDSKSHREHTTIHGRRTSQGGVLGVGMSSVGMGSIGGDGGLEGASSHREGFRQEWVSDFDGGGDVEIGVDPPHVDEGGLESLLPEGQEDLCAGCSGDGGAPSMYLCLNMIFDCHEGAFALAVGDGGLCSGGGGSHIGESQQEWERRGWGAYEYRKLSDLCLERKEARANKLSGKVSVACKRGSDLPSRI